MSRDISKIQKFKILKVSENPYFLLIKNREESDNKFDIWHFGGAYC